MPGRYVQIAASEVPAGVRFDVPLRNQGQMIEVAYGGFDRGQHGHGDPYKRIVDHTGGAPTFWRWTETRDSRADRIADRIDGYDRDDLGESPDY